MASENESVLMDISPSQESMYSTKTVKYRRAFNLIKTGGVSIRQASISFSLNRKQLAKEYTKFVDSGIEICEWIYEKPKKGRKPLLNPINEASMRIAIHTLDSIGHPASGPSLNQIIQKLKQKESRKNQSNKGPCKSSLRRYRLKSKIPKKSVRNGTTARSDKSKEEYILDFAEKLQHVISLYSIKKKHMFVKSVREKRGRRAK
jgi:hypothetical protein